MFKVPEYHWLASGQGAKSVTVTVEIDGDASVMPETSMTARDAAGLAKAFLAGKLKFMSFDEHPKRLTRISLVREGAGSIVELSARSLDEKDDFPRDWEPADFREFGARH